MVTSSHPQQIVRLSGPQGMVAAAAQSLGFEPSDSIVIVACYGPRTRVGPVLRADLEALSSLVDDVVLFAARYADEIAVLVYHDGPRPKPLNGLLTALRQSAVPVAMVLSICDGRIRDARTASRFAKDRGIPVLRSGDEQYDRLMATAALAGRRVLANRQELAASIAPPRGADITALAAGIERMIASADPAASDQQRCDTVDEVLSLTTAEYRERCTLSDATAARLIAAATPTVARDHLLARAVTWPDPEIVAMLGAAAARCPTAHAAQLCSVLGAVAYRFGDGALAHCALDRAEEAAPGHRLTGLLRQAVVSGLPPEVFVGLGGDRVPVS